LLGIEVEVGLGEAVGDVLVLEACSIGKTESQRVFEGRE
jgi:hypothetical protein